MTIKTKKQVWKDEKELISLLINRTDKEGRPSINYFMNMVEPPISDEIAYHFKGVYIASNVPRTQLGFTNDRKPGDYDVLLIPYTENHILFQFTSVYEVKVTRATNKNPTKGSNSLGTTQMKGLIQDGFPLVNLFHICMSEPANNENLTQVNLCKIPANSDVPIPPNFNIDDYSELKGYDPLSSNAADNQIRRLIAMDIPKYVGIIAIGLDINKQDELMISSNSYDLENFCHCYFNPKRKLETLQKVKNHFENFNDQYLKIEFNKNNCV